MREIRSFLAAVLFCTAMAVFCIKTFDMAGNIMESGPQLISGAGGAAKTAFFQKLSGEREKTVQRAFFAFSIEELERMLSENRGQERQGGRYMEAVSSIYHYPKAYSGALAAYYEDGGTMAFRMVMADDGIDERQEYECRLLNDGSLWFTYRTESESRMDLPDYTVNEILRYARADYVYDDGMNDTEEERRNREEELERYMAKETAGETQEFWRRGEKLYRIDREEERFVEVTEEKESRIADFLAEQSGRIDGRLPVSEDTLAEIENHKPEGYSLLWEKNGWNDIAACDLNHDGKMDYVAALYPDDYEEVRHYADGSPYENWPQYYAAGFWLLLSGDDGSYERIQLSESIEYWEKELSLVETAFVEDGVLELEYFVGRSPFSNAVLRFQYDEETRDFYIVRSDYRDGYNDAMLTGDLENYGQTSMRDYFTDRQHYCEGIWDSYEDISLPDGNMIGYFSDSFQYRCMNLIEERRINSLIQDKEYELLNALWQEYPDGNLDVNMVTDAVYYSPQIVSGQVEIYFNDEENNFIRIRVPVMIDKQSGAYVMVTELTEKEEFLRIALEWAEDSLSSGAITAEEKISFESVIEENWEKAELVENYMDTESRILSLQIVEGGVRLGVRQKTDDMLDYDYYLIDKEYFIGTKIWEYYR